MDQNYTILADLVLLIHGMIVAYIVLGLLLILIGRIWRWQWVSNPWFRVTHLAGIAIVVLQAWLGRLCPLTILEAWLRRQGGDAVHQQSFIQHWLQRIIYYEFPFWVFAIAYTVFALLVVLAWIKYPPDFDRRN